MQGSLLWDGQAAQLSMRGVPFGGSQWSPRLFPSCTRPNGKRESFFPSFLRVPLSGLCHSKSPCMLDPAVMCAAQVPNLGVCAQDFKTTVFADVPGLLEGAHEGLGLGHEFLRHVSRCRALVHIIDGSSPDPVGDWEAINLELELFNPAIKDKPQDVALHYFAIAIHVCMYANATALPMLYATHAPVIAYNKIDLPDSGEFWEDVREELVAKGADPAGIFPMSAATGQGVTVSGGFVAGHAPTKESSAEVLPAVLRGVKG
eukprot:1158241-Pelagomonas_calceolata.AAC.4